MTLDICTKMDFSYDETPTLALPLNHIRFNKKSKRNALTPTQLKPGIENAESPKKTWKDDSQKNCEQNENTKRNQVFKFLSRPRKRGDSSPPSVSPENMKRFNIGGGYYDNLSDGDLLFKLIKYDRKFHRLLVKFAESEWSSETVHFFDALDKYKAEPTFGGLKLLYEDYIRVGAQHEINLECTLRERISEYVTNNTNIPDEVVYELEMAVASLLIDIYNRFSTSGMYKKYY